MKGYPIFKSRPVGYELARLSAHPLQETENDIPINPIGMWEGDPDRRSPPELLQPFTGRT